MSPESARPLTVGTSIPGCQRGGVDEVQPLRRPASPDPGVQDAGDVPRAGQVTRGDSRASDLGRIKPGQLSSVQSPEQPPGLVRQWLPVAGRPQVDDSGQLQIRILPRDILRLGSGRF